MRNYLIGMITVLISFVVISCNGENKSDTNSTGLVKANDSINERNNSNADSDTIYVYYFHGSIRCKTCVSVDENTHRYLQEFYSDKFKNGTMVFQSLNADKDERLDLIKKYKIWGQTLLFIKGDKIVDVTEDAFMYVTTDPDKWKYIVKENMDKLIKS